MSSLSPKQNGHASSSRSPLSSASTSPPEDDDEGLDLASGLLEEEDPLDENGAGTLDQGCASTY